MKFLLTIDVESQSINLNRDDPDTVRQINDVALPNLLEMFSKHDVCSTFFFTGKFAEVSPESIEM